MCYYIQRRFDQQKLATLNTNEAFINIEEPLQDKIEKAFQNSGLQHYVNCRIWEGNWNGVYAKKIYEDNPDKMKNIIENLQINFLFYLKPVESTIEAFERL